MPDSRREPRAEGMRPRLRGTRASPSPIESVDRCEWCGKALRALVLTDDGSVWVSASGGCGCVDSGESVRTVAQDMPENRA
jgi:hypothetical protein